MSKVNELIQQYTDDAIEIRRHIHRHPELSMEEKNTTEFISQQLLKYGIEISDIPFKSGVLGILKGGEDGHIILLRADIDALPMVEKSGLPFASENTGVCHSCGHDIHTTSLLLAARVLSSLRDELKGTVLFLFQPAEERLSGSQMVIDSGVFENYHPDFAVGLHCWPDIPAGTIGIRRGSFMASSDTVKLTIRGKGGHGAHPHKSIDPVMTSAYILTELQTIISRTIAPLDSAVLTIGKITGGTAANIIPDEVVMEGTVRTVSNETRALMEEKIRQIVSHGAAAMGAECDIVYQKGIPAVVCDNHVVDLIEQAAAEELGADHVVTLATPSMGSEDFSRYLEKVPGAMFRIGTRNDDPASSRPLHNAGIVFDEQAITSGASVFAGLALRYLH